MIIGVFLTLVATFMSIILHEIAHGYVAYRLGDDTAKKMGRLSLNPKNHVDIFGTIFLPLALLWSGSGVLFGWAKPVPINYYNFKNPKKDIFLVSIAGIVVNAILALIAAGILYILPEPIPNLLLAFVIQLLVINIVLILFNLLPIPPLDGSKIFFGWVDMPWAKKYVAAERQGLAVLIFIMLMPSIINIAFGVRVFNPWVWYVSSVLNFFLE